MEKGKLKPALRVVYVALGSNLGDREAYLALARTRLEELRATRIIGATEVEETLAVGPIRQPRFLNQMVALRTGLAPEELLEACQAIEREAGRTRPVPKGPRTLDLDLVWFEGIERRDPRLMLPHPAIEERAFWRREMERLDDVVWPDRPRDG